MSETAILFLYLDQINSLDTLISSISTPNIVIIDSNEFDIDVITDTVNNIANLQHVGFLYEHSATTNGFPVYLTNILQVVVEKNPNCIIDLLTCNLNSIAQREHIKSLENTYNITIRYSVDLTGHQDSMGNWIMESHNVSVKTIYFNETIDQWKHTLSASTKYTLNGVKFNGTHQFGQSQTNEQRYNINYYIDTQQTASSMSFDIEYNADKTHEWTHTDTIRITINNPENKNYGGGDSDDWFLLTHVDPTSKSGRATHQRYLEPSPWGVSSDIVDATSGGNGGLAWLWADKNSTTMTVEVEWPEDSANSPLWLVFLLNNTNYTTWYMKVPIPSTFNTIDEYFNNYPDEFTRLLVSVDGDDASPYSRTVNVPFYGDHEDSDLNYTVNYYYEGSGSGFNITYDKAEEAPEIKLTLTHSLEDKNFSGGTAKNDWMFVTDVDPNTVESDSWDSSNRIDGKLIQWSTKELTITWQATRTSRLWLVFLPNDGWTSKWFMELPYPWNYEFTMKEIQFQGTNQNNPSYDLNGQIDFDIEYKAIDNTRIDKFDQIKLTISETLASKNFSGGTGKNDWMFVTKVSPEGKTSWGWMDTLRSDGENKAEQHNNFIQGNDLSLTVPWSDTPLWLVFLPNNGWTSTCFMKLPMSSNFFILQHILNTSYEFGGSSTYSDFISRLNESDKLHMRYTYSDEYTARNFRDLNIDIDTAVMFQFTPGELFEAGYKMSDFIVRPSHKELLQYGFTLKDIYPDLIDSLEWEGAIDTSIANISVSNPELPLTGHALAANKQSIATIHERATVGTHDSNNNLYERNSDDIPIRVAVFDINDDRSALIQRGYEIKFTVGTSFTDGDETYDTAYASWAMTGNIVISADGNIIAFATDYTKWDEGSLTSYGDIINVIHTYKYDKQNNMWNPHGNIIRSSNYTSMVMSALGDTIVLGGGDIDSISAPVLVYKYDGASTWTKVATLDPPTETAKVFNSYFGSKLSISPDAKHILVGALNEKRTDFPVEVRVPKEIHHKGVYGIDIYDDQPATVYGVVYTYNLNDDAWELDLDHDMLAPSIRYLNKYAWDKLDGEDQHFANLYMDFNTEYAESMCHGYKNIEMVGFNSAFGLNYIDHDAQVGFAIKGQYTSDETFKSGKNFLYAYPNDYYTYAIAANSACSHGLTSDGLVRLAATNGNHNGALFEFAYKGENTYPDIDVPHSLLVENAPLTGTFINTVDDLNSTGFVNSLEQNADNMLLSVRYETPFGGGRTSIVDKLASEDDLSAAEITGETVSQDITISKMVVTISNIPTTLDNYLMYVVNENTVGIRAPSIWKSDTNINGMFSPDTHNLFNLTSGEITTTINWTNEYDETPFIVIAKIVDNDDDDDIHIPIWYMRILRPFFNDLADQWTQYQWPAYFNVHANSFGDRNAAGFQAPHAKTKELFNYNGYDRSNIGIGISANGALVVTTGDLDNTIAIYSESDPNFNETAVTALTKDDINALDKSFAQKILKYLITKDSHTSLDSLGFTFNELFASDSYNLTPAEMITAGYTIQMGHDDGLTNVELLAGGFTASHYKDAGYNVNQAADAGVSLIELGSGFTVDEFKTAGISVADAVTAGFSYDDMITAGYGASDFTASGISISDLHTSDITYSNIKNAGFSAADFKAGGVSVTDALDAGFTISELLDSGYTDTELHDDAGKTWALIYRGLHTDGNLDITKLNTLTKETIQAYDPRFQQAVISHMIDNTLSVSGEYIDLNTKGFTITELKVILSSLTVTQCKNVGYSPVHMSQSGIFSSDAIAGVYNETSDIIASVNIISLNGASELYIDQDSTYHDAGATVITSNGTSTLYSTMTVDTETVGQYQLLYSHEESGLEVLRIVNVITVPPVYNSDSPTNGPYMVNDIFPVYTDSELANNAGDGSSNLQNINDITYYVPNDAYVMNGTDNYDSTRVVKITVHQGWNLISYRKQVKLWKSQVWTGVIWEYDGSAYIQSSDISADKGYWVNATVSGDIYATIKNI